MNETTVTSIKRQFFAAVPVPKIQWNEIFKNISWKQQEELLYHTVLHVLNKKHPLKNDYQIAFLKYVIKALEKQGPEAEIHDKFYESLAEKLNIKSGDYSHKHYFVDEDVITIKESSSFIRDGTTGLSLWPASLTLAEYLVKNKDLFNDKSILELGSGIGLTGIVLLKACKTPKIYLSDCHESVLEKLVENIDANLLGHNCETIECSTLHVRQRLKVDESRELGVLNLTWENIEESKGWLEKHCIPDIILASDVVYDDSIFDSLIHCLKNLFELSTSLIFYLAQSIRSQETFNTFCKLLEKNNFQMEEELRCPADIFKYEEFTENPTEIKILKIFK
ncbi:unnamed protein product [Diamesa hyperborea]